MEAKVPAIFRDLERQQLFEEQGYVIVPFLEQHEVAHLLKTFYKLHPNLSNQGGFVSGSYSNDTAYKQQASESIIKVFNPNFERLFIDWQTFGAAYLYKPPSEGSELGVHQDWTIVDEEQFVALNCWVPLVDTDEQNGTLQVLPASQYSKVKTLRAPTIPFFFAGQEAKVIQATIPIYIKAGEAVILNQSVVHYSTPNRSQAIRPAITAGVKSKTAPMLFHYKTEEDMIEQYAMPEGFLLEFQDFYTSIFERPTNGALIKKFLYQNPILSEVELAHFLKNMKQDKHHKPQSLLHSLLAKIGYK